MIFSAQSRALVCAAEPHWQSKLTLRALTFTLSLIGLITLVSHLPNTLGAWPLLIPLAASVKWNLAVIGVRLLRARPMHPGACIALDFVLWAVLLPLAGAAILVGNTLRSPAMASDVELDLALALDPLAFDDAVDGRAGPLILAAAGLAGIACILHFILAVWACVDTHQRRRSEHGAMVSTPPHLKKWRYQDIEGEPLTAVGPDSRSRQSSHDDTSSGAPSEVPAALPREDHYDYRGQYQREADGASPPDPYAASDFRRGSPPGCVSEVGRVYAEMEEDRSGRVGRAVSTWSD